MAKIADFIKETSTTTGTTTTTDTTSTTNDETPEVDQNILFIGFGSILALVLISIGYAAYNKS